MEYSPTSRRTRKPPPPKQSDLYSTVFIHNQEKDDVEEDPSSDIYATTVFKDDNDSPVDNQNDDDSLPPLLKRLPKDFGLDPTLSSDGDDDQYGAASVSGTMIVKTTTGNSKPRGIQFWDRTEKKSNDNAALYRRRNGNDEEEEEGNFSTFVVREGEEEEEEEMGPGTVVRRTRKKSRGGTGSGTLSRAVASMQAVGEMGGFGRQSKSGSGKVSTSSIPENVTKEDPLSMKGYMNSGRDHMVLCKRLEIKELRSWLPSK